MKWIRTFSAIILIVLVLTLIDQLTIRSISTSYSDSTSLVDEIVFPHDKVVDVYIDIDEATYEEMIENAMNEEVVMADITYNGYTFSSVGIRPKGNSSLKSIVNSESNRYSFKIDFNYYLNDQSFYGITKLNLNNLFSDPSMMAEYLGYEMMSELNAVSPRTTYVALHINGEYSGLYLAVEQVNEPFLQENFGNSNGELYKPEMGTGSNLKYTSENGLDYTGLIPENLDNYNNDNIVELMKVINEGGDLESVMNVDSFLKYLAMSTITIHLDSYQGSMFHNYYLYNNNGIFEWITWDLNMIFNGFPKLSDEEAIGFLIDEPVVGSMENYPLVKAVFENEEYVSRYHEYIESLINSYLSKDRFTQRVTEIYQMIKGYVEVDPTAFYSYEEFEEALFTDNETNISLLSFVERRIENIREQLDGIIPSTNNGEGNTGTGGKMGGMNARGMRPDGMQEAFKQDKNLEGEEQKGLPPGRNIEDLPDDIREKIEQGEMPPRENPEGIGHPGEGMPKGQDEEVAQNQSNSLSKTDAALVGVMTIVMIGTTIYLSKKW